MRRPIALPPARPGPTQVNDFDDLTEDVECGKLNSVKGPPPAPTRHHPGTTMTDRAILDCDGRLTHLSKGNYGFPRSTTVRLWIRAKWTVGRRMGPGMFNHPALIRRKASAVAAVVIPLASRIVVTAPVERG